MAERAVLGGLLLENRSLSDVLEILDPSGEDFYHTANGLIFRTIIDLINRWSITADIITVCDALSSAKRLDGIGCHAYVCGLADDAISAVNVRDYARIIKEKSIKRRFITTGVWFTSVGYDPTSEVEAIESEAQRKIFVLSLSEDKKTIRASRDIVRQAFSTIEARRQKGGQITGLSTGFSQLDNVIGGLPNGNLIIIAGRPSMGKTALAVNIAVNRVLERHPTLVFSLEMPADGLMTRILSQVTELDSRHLSRGLVRDDQWPKLANAAQKIGEAPLFIDDNVSVTPTEIRAKARQMKAEHQIELMIVDYLQLMRIPGRHDTREQQVAEISRTLKGIARELDIPVIALSQLNRQVEQRVGDKRLGMGDLRESGAIEQDADIIAFIYRDEVYNKSENNPEKGLAEIIIGKNRNGPTGTIKLKYNAKFTRFENLQEGPYD